ncbi:MAG: hypothetical protein WBO70_06415 [Erysipelotrichaceae bacterium]
MKFYNDINSTPLKWHKFVMYFSIPLSFIVSCYNLYVLINIFDKNNYSVLMGDVFYSLITIVLCLVVFFGFRKFKYYGYWGIYAYMLSNIAYGSYTLFFFIKNPIVDITQVIIQLITSIIYGVVVGYYYYKRKNLFVN